MNEGIDNPSSEHAATGRLGHALGEHCLIKQITVQQAYDSGIEFDVSDKGDKSDMRRPDAEMVEFIQGYVDRCNDFIGEHFIEKKVAFDPWIPGGFGTCDFICVNPYNYTLVVRDLKYGMGVKVDAEENKQLLLYAIGAYEEFSLTYDIRQVLMEIDQPRLDHVSSWTIPIHKGGMFA
jgi:hypothetical protein